MLTEHSRFMRCPRAHARRGMTRPLFLTAFSCALLVSACRGEKPSPEPTEPWRAAPVVTETTATQSPPLVFKPSASSALSFRLPGKEAAPQGTVRGLGGTCALVLSDLRKSRGTLTFDLDTLAIAADTVGDDPERTRDALNWLELGAEVPEKRRASLRRGRFEVDAIHQPSATAVERRRAVDHLQTVSAILAGRLVLRGLSVEQRVPVELAFHFDPERPSDTEPQRFVVRLKNALRVPLAEHEIAPRDQEGRALPANFALLGRTVGRVAEVNTELTWERVEAHDAEDASPAPKRDRP